MKINKLLFIIGLYSNTFGAPTTNIPSCKAFFCQYTESGAKFYFLSTQMQSLTLYKNIK